MPSVQPSKSPGCSVGEEPGAVLGAGLLVGGERDHDVPAGPYARARPVPDDREDHRVHVLHVDRAAAPHHAVADLAGERVHGPVAGLGGHHVQMTVDEQGVGRRVGALDPGDDVGTALGALQQGGLQARLGQPRGGVLGGGPLPAVAAAAVGGVDPDEVGGERSPPRRAPAVDRCCPSAILLLHRGRDDRRDRLEGANALVHGRRWCTRPSVHRYASHPARRWRPSRDARRRTPAPR